MVKKRKKSNKTIYILLGIIVLLVIFVVVGKSAGWIGKPPETEVELAEVKTADITEIVSASGTVQPVTEVKLSPDVAGEIIELNVEEGDSVRMGELLIKIRPDALESALERSQALFNQNKANLAQAKSALSKAEAQFIRAELEYNRNEELYEEKVISDADYEVAEANYKIAKNDLEAAKQNVVAAQYVVESSRATVKEAMENLQFTNVLAPMSGIVSKLSVEKGERVVGTRQMAGTEMLRIADLTNMEVRVDVNENDIIRVAQGDTAIIEVDSYTYMDKKFKGVVTQIANTANEKVSPDAVTEFEVRIKILNESYQDLLEENENLVSPFRPGMTASVDIITEKKEDVVAVPLSAVTTRENENNENSDNEDGEEENETQEGVDIEVLEEDEEQEVVFISEDGKAKLTKVTTGISDFENIEILSGLEPGQKIVSGPFSAVSKRLNDGDLITVKEDKKKKSEEE